MVLTKTGVSQGDLITLLEKATGELWIPISMFNDIGAAVLGAVGGVRAVGMALDTSADEHVDVTLKVPKDMDVKVASTFTAYWSSSGTNGSQTFLGSIDFTARAVGEDVGVAVTAAAGTADADSATADVLNTAPVIALPADTFASTAELLFLSFFRDVSGDDVAGDVHFYGLLWEYTTLPRIKV